MSRILAVDDRPINIQFLASLLRYGGHDILQASSGEEALDIVRRSHPDLIITDVKMPNMDGYEFVDRLREDEEIAETPVIFYTALYHELEAHLVAESYGVKDIINKPAEPEEILNKVNAALGKWGSYAASGTAARSEFGAHATGLKLSALVELGMELGSERDPSKLLSRFCSTARHIISARKSMLGILSETGDELKHFLINGLSEAEPTIQDRPLATHPLLKTIVRDRKVVRINYGEANSLLDGLCSQSPSARSILGVPLMSSNQVYGFLILVEKQQHSLFNDEDERLAITLAAQAAVAYENVVFSERLRVNAIELDWTRREHLEMKDDFISSVSHELRSPLAALHQFATILLDASCGEMNIEERESLEVVLGNSRRLRDLVDDLLEITRAEAGKVSIDPQPVSLFDLFRPVVHTYEKRAADKGLAFESTCPIGLPHVQADARRIDQVLSILMDNALKFTTKGTISIGGGRDQNSQFMLTTVADTGSGISKEDLPKIFDGPNRPPSKSGSTKRGLGLGLAIAKHLVELHGGSIWAESQEKQGTKVMFTLPIATSETR